MSKIRLLSAAIALLCLLVPSAYCTVEVQITDASGTTTYTGTSCGTNCTAVVASDSDSSFNLDIQLGASSTSNGEPSLTIGGVVYADKSETLKIQVSDTGFTSPLGQVNLAQTLGTIAPPGAAATGSVTAQGYYGTGTGNTYFCSNTATCTGGTSTLSLGSLGSTSAVLTTSRSANIPSTYSLDELLDYSFTSSGYADAAGEITVTPAVAPESTTLFLVGTSLVAAALIKRKSKP